MALLKDPTEADLPGLVQVFEAAEVACSQDGFERAREALEDIGTPEALGALKLLMAIPEAMISLLANKSL